MRQIRVIGVDLAKHVFQLDGVDGAGEVVLRKRLKRQRPVESRPGRGSRGMDMLPATALVGLVGEGPDRRNGPQLAAHLGNDGPSAGASASAAMPTSGAASFMEPGP
jgi:hypothetical protein